MKYCTFAIYDFYKFQKGFSYCPLPFLAYFLSKSWGLYVVEAPVSLNVFLACFICGQDRVILYSSNCQTFLGFVYTQARLGLNIGKAQDESYVRISPVSKLRAMCLQQIYTSEII